MCGAEKVAKQKSKQSQPKRTRINWSKEPHLAKLRKAVDDWNTKAGDCEPTDRLAEFAQRVGIPLGTLSQYVAGGQPKLQVGAGSVGRPSTKHSAITIEQQWRWHSVVDVPHLLSSSN